MKDVKLYEMNDHHIENVLDHIDHNIRFACQKLQNSVITKDDMEQELKYELIRLIKRQSEPKTFTDLVKLCRHNIGFFKFGQGRAHRRKKLRCSDSGNVRIDHIGHNDDEVTASSDILKKISTTPEYCCELQDLVIEDAGPLLPFVQELINPSEDTLKKILHIKRTKRCNGLGKKSDLDTLPRYIPTRIMTEIFGVSQKDFLNFKEKLRKSLKLNGYDLNLNR